MPLPAWLDWTARVVGGSLVLFGALPYAMAKLICSGCKYQDAVLLGTGVASVWYTVETLCLRWETVRQNEIAVRPFVVANIEYRQIGSFPVPIIGPELVMKNIGRGLALFIQIDDMILEPRYLTVPVTGASIAPVAVALSGLWQRGDRMGPPVAAVAREPPE
jgi:hypothetical protein